MSALRNRLRLSRSLFNLWGSRYRQLSTASLHCRGKGVHLHKQFDINKIAGSHVCGCSLKYEDILSHMSRGGFHTSANHQSNKANNPESIVEKDEYLKDILKEINQDFKDAKSEENDLSSSVSSDDQPTSEADLDHNVLQKPAIDIDEELLRYDYEEFVEKDRYDVDDEDEEEEEYSISLERGSTGVFNVDEVVQVLKEDNAIDLCVIQIPPEIKYVDHMVIVTGRSTRHLQAMAQYIKRLFKLKRRKGDSPTCIIEGKQTEWLAIDLGNIVVHLFSASVRETYDLETLWTVGPEYDQQSHTQTDDELLTSFWDQSEFSDLFTEPKVSDHDSKTGIHDSADNWHKKT